MPDQLRHEIAVIIVGLNACDYVRGALQSLYAAEWHGKSHEIIYVDNGSTDQSTDMVKSEYPGVRIIENETNLGFCYAANQGAEIAISKYYFFLNDDTIVLNDAIAVLSDFLDATPEAGVVGSRLLNTDMSDQWSGRNFPTMSNAIFGRRSALSKLFPNAKPLTDYICKEQVLIGKPFRTDWVSAAALMVRQECFNEIKGFAENYYYWHEAVFCDRIRNNGLEIYLHPDSKIIHFEGKGSGKRTFKAQKFHIIDFHKGAFRCYMEHYHLRPHHPICLLVAGALFARAALLLTISRIIHPK